MKRDMLLQIRELLERHVNVIDIAAKLNIDIDTVKLAVDIIKEIIT
jgi:Mn-dependent DtxR family transcriptional regulator